MCDVLCSGTELLGFSSGRPLAAITWNSKTQVSAVGVWHKMVLLSSTWHEANEKQTARCCVGNVARNAEGEHAVWVDVPWTYLCAEAAWAPAAAQVLLAEKPRRLRPFATVRSEEKKEQTGFVWFSAKYHWNNSLRSADNFTSSTCVCAQATAGGGERGSRTYSAQREEAKEMQKLPRRGSTLRGGHHCRSPSPKISPPMSKKN